MKNFFIVLILLLLFSFNPAYTFGDNTLPSGNENLSQGLVLNKGNFIVDIKDKSISSIFEELKKLTGAEITPLRFVDENKRVTVKFRERDISNGILHLMKALGIGNIALYEEKNKISKIVILPKGSEEINPNPAKTSIVLTQIGSNDREATAINLEEIFTKNVKPYFETLEKSLPEQKDATLENPEIDNMAKQMQSSLMSQLKMLTGNNDKL